MLYPHWPVPAHVKAVCFDRLDEPSLIQQQLPSTFQALNQVHGNHVVQLPCRQESVLTADGCYSQSPQTLCTVRTADCLAIYLASTHTPEIALLHGGWRGLSQNIISQGVSLFKSPRSRIVAYLGPAISAACYEVGHEVYEAFCSPQAELAQAFQTTRPGHYQCDLYRIARWQLQQQGIEQIHGGEFCTFSDTRFPSFRRDGQQAERLLHCLWLDFSH